MEERGVICHCTRMGRRHMRRFLSQRSEKDLPALIEFQRITGAGRRCTGCALDLARAYAAERMRREAELSNQPLLWSEY